MWNIRLKSKQFYQNFQETQSFENRFSLPNSETWIHHIFKSVLENNTNSTPQIEANSETSSKSTKFPLETQKKSQRIFFIDWLHCLFVFFCYSFHCGLKQIKKYIPNKFQNLMMIATVLHILTWNSFRFFSSDIPQFRI